MDATPVTEFDVYEVDTAVNSIRNNGPELLNPKGEAPEPEAGTLF